MTTDGAESCRRAFGLTFQSDLPLPELPTVATGSTVDVTIRRAAIVPGAEFDERGMAFWVGGSGADEFGYAYRGVAAFLVQNGRRILVDAEAGILDEVVRLSLLGPALGLLLHQRGLHVLHASTVAYRGAAVSFVGAGGWGKSTTVALLQALGWELVSDDLTALILPSVESPTNESRVLALPGFAQVKLWPDAAIAAGADVAALPKLHPGFEKRALRSIAAFAPEPRPVRRIYALGFGDRLTVETASVQEGFAELARHFYGARFGPDFLRTLGAEAMLLRAATLLRAASVRRLLRPDTTLAAPREMAATIERLIIADLAT
ncbi:MAG: hypothetical protein AB7O52_16230 [Planctomycetota bacterium]